MIASFSDPEIEDESGIKEKTIKQTGKFSLLFSRLKFAFSATRDGI